MSFKKSYFYPGDWHPKRLIEHLLNPSRPLATIQLRGHPLLILATRRAAKALSRRATPITVEMQLYFSCVVKKRVLFHEEPSAGVIVSDKLLVLFRPVEALSCDPVEFAANYPVRQQLTSIAAEKMHPSRLCLDYRQGDRNGEFTI